MTHKELTAKIRKEIKTAGVSARVRLQYNCGDSIIQVFTKVYEIHFTEQEQHIIKNIAIVNGLSLVRGMKITMDYSVNPNLFNFYNYGI